jgi:hypothetical protein
MPQGIAPIENAVRCTAMVAIRRDGQRTVALTRSNAAGQFQRTTHGGYGTGDEAFFVASFMVDRLNALAAAKGSFVDADVHWLHACAEGALASRPRRVFG